MATEATLEQGGSVWRGGVRPMNASYGKLMMWFFLITDALTFSGFLTAYGFSRFKYADVWPVPEDVFTHFPFMHGDHPLLYVALMTFILIMSSVTMVLAVNAGHHMNKRGVIVWMFWTIIGGLIFVGSQAWEWMHFIHGTEEGALVLLDGSIAHFVDGMEGALRLANRTIVSGAEAAALMADATPIHGATLVANEYGVPLFADFFFFITGFHGFHVFSGVVINTVIFINVIKGTYERRGHYEMVEKVGLYWHFVDLVWVFVFTFFYLV